MTHSYGTPLHSLSKQSTFHGATSGLLTKWSLRNECRNSILMSMSWRITTQIYFSILSVVVQFFLISDYEINHTKLFYSNYFWTVSHLFSLRKTLLDIPDSTNFLVELTAKQLTKQRELQAPLKGGKLGLKLIHHYDFWLNV